MTIKHWRASKVCIYLFFLQWLYFWWPIKLIAITLHQCIIECTRPNKVQSKISIFDVFICKRYLSKIFRWFFKLKLHHLHDNDTLFISSLLRFYRLASKNCLSPIVVHTQQQHTETPHALKMWFISDVNLFSYQAVATFITLLVYKNNSFIFSHFKKAKEKILKEKASEPTDEIVSNKFRIIAATKIWNMSCTGYSL